MVDFKMTHNGSGYYDETAYKGVNEMAKPGEVWSYLTNTGLKKYVLIIANHGTFCTALNLVDDDSCESVEICEIDYIMKYTDPRMLQYIYNSNLIRPYHAMCDEKFNEILNDISSALNISGGEEKDGFVYRECYGEMLALFGDKAVENYCRCSYLLHLLNGNEDAAHKYMNKLSQIMDREA